MNRTISGNIRYLVFIRASSLSPPRAAVNPNPYLLNIRLRITVSTSDTKIMVVRGR